MSKASDAERPRTLIRPTMPVDPVRKDFSHQGEVKLVVFDGLADAIVHLRAAEARNETIDLVTRQAASAYLGAAYIAALETQLREQSPALDRLIYDCGSFAGHAMRAAMHGIGHVRVDAAIATPALVAFCRLRGTVLLARGD